MRSERACRCLRFGFVLGFSVVDWIGAKGDVGKMNVRVLGAFLILGLILSACDKESGLQRPPDLSIYFTTNGGNEGDAFDPTKAYTLPPPGVNNESFLDVSIFNQGDGDMRLLNVYLAEGSNPYVSLEWAETDPSGQGRFSSGQPVVPCALATGVLSDPSLLPAAQGVNLTQCSFPMDLAGKDPVTSTVDYRKVRLRYSFDISQDVPNNSPVNLIVQVDWQEGSLGNQGVVNIPLQVQGCIPELVVYPPYIEFSDAKVGSTDEVQVCLSNTGCEALTVSGVVLNAPAFGDVFDIEDQRVCSGNLRPCATNNDCGECVGTLNYCSSDLECGVGGTCEANAGGSCELQFGQTVAGATIIPQQEDPEAQVCFKVTYTPIEAAQVNPEQNFIVVQTNDPIQPSVTIPLSTGTDCEASYELTHTDEVDSGLPYMDFTSVQPGETAQKIITVTNTGGTLGCPIKLQSLQFSNSNDQEKNGGPYSVEVRKKGETHGFFGKIGTSNFSPFSVAGDAAFDLVVTFVAPADATAGPTELKLSMDTGGAVFSRTVSIQAGQAQSKLVLGPSAVAAGNQAAFWFSAGEGESSEKTLALYNEGLAPVILDRITLDDGNGNDPPDFYLVDDGECVVGGEFTCGEVPPLDMIALTVAFESETGLPNPDGFLYVWTDEDPFTGETSAIADYSVNLEAQIGLAVGIPVANVVAAGSVFSTGDAIALDASGSTASQGTTLVDAGYKWWISSKPAGSTAKLNVIGQSAQTLNVDKPGLYTVSVVATAKDTGTGDFLNSDEAFVEIAVE